MVRVLARRARALVAEHRASTSDNLQLREHERDELAHYAKEGAGTFDIEYRFPFTAPGFGELEGIAHRGDFDLRQHQKHARVEARATSTPETQRDATSRT